MIGRISLGGYILTVYHLGRLKTLFDAEFHLFYADLRHEGVKWWRLFYFTAWISIYIGKMVLL